MFLKRYLRRMNGKVHTYWALVESVRTAKGSRHKVVAHLGELTRHEKSGWDQLAKNLPPSRRPQPSLFDPPAAEGGVKVQRWAEQKCSTWLQE